MCIAHAADDGKESLSLAACSNDLAIRDFDAMSLPRVRRAGWIVCKSCSWDLHGPPASGLTVKLSKSTISIAPHPAVVRGGAPEGQ
jgi:hypothetical protein